MPSIVLGPFPVTAEMLSLFEQKKMEGTLVFFASLLLSKLSAQKPSSGTSLFVYKYGNKPTSP